MARPITVTFSYQPSDARKTAVAVVVTVVAPVTTKIVLRAVGSRPGEKIHEELWSGNESLGETAHPKIWRLSRSPVDPDWLALQLGELERLADEGDTLEVVGKLGAIVREPRRVESPQLSDTGSYRLEIDERAVRPPVDSVE